MKHIIYTASLIIATLLISGCATTTEKQWIYSHGGGTTLSAIKKYKIYTPKKPDEVALLACYKDRFEEWTCTQSFLYTSYWKRERNIEFHSPVSSNIFIKLDPNTDRISFSYSPQGYSFDCKITMDFKKESNAGENEQCYSGYKKYNHQDYLDYQKKIAEYY